MAKDIEEIKLIVDLAKNGGMLEEQNKQLMTENTAVKTENETVKAENRALRDENLALKERVRELEAMVAGRITSDGANANAAGAPQVVYVHQYFLLDCPKTMAYVGGLDDRYRMFAGHFLHQTMADNTPRHIYEQVDKITQLEGCQNKRMADAMEKIADKPNLPTIQADKVYQSGSIHDDHSSNINLDTANPQNLLE